ncbi:hypothetical protein [Paracoccus sediminicola]|uniref:hypothetical protein n=1 Tax=Paracoccus sediminicola TaxID=3017783 RepID=UPI0022F01136|nr:hypothetical protein [Paracoccus sediminicola]WBU56516.1 hypothetical protein PAF18_13730 [Paracoccus sediminicola]
MTVQTRGCKVSQHYICAADRAGDQHVVYYDREGPSYHSKIDAETRWLESNDLNTGLSDFLVPDAPDHASFSTLIETGRDDFDFWTVSNSGERLRNIGEDQLTGETATIDGVELELTEFKLDVFSEDGQLLIQSRGQQFISRSHGRFYGGIEQSSDWTGERYEENDSPVTFAFPGEDGFGMTEPLFDCEIQMVRATPLSPGDEMLRTKLASVRTSTRPYLQTAARPDASHISGQEVAQ